MTLTEILAALAENEERSAALEQTITDRRAEASIEHDVLGVYALDDDNNPTDERTRADLVGLTETEAAELIDIEAERAVLEADRVRAERVQAAAPSNRFTGTAPNVNLNPDPHDPMAMHNRTVDDMRAMATTALEARHIRPERAETIMETVDEVTANRLYGSGFDQTEKAVLQHIATFASPQYNEMFHDALFFGESGKARKFTAQNAVITTGTGFQFPIDIDPTMVRIGTVTQYSQLRNRLTIRRGTANTHYVNTVGASTFAKRAEGGESGDATPADATVAITATPSSGTLTWSIEAEQDLPSLAAELQDNADAGMMNHEADQILTGDNTGVNVQGFLEGTTITRVETDTTAVVDEDDLLDVLNAIPAHRLEGTVWVANQKTYNALRKLEASSGGGRLMEDSWGRPTPPQMLGFDRLVHSGMDGPTGVDTFTADDDVMIVGPVGHGYRVYIRLGAQAEYIPHLFHTDNNLPKGVRGVFINYRWGAKIVDAASMRILHIAS